MKRSNEIARVALGDFWDRVKKETKSDAHPPAGSTLKLEVEANCLVEKFIEANCSKLPRDFTAMVDHLRAKPCADPSLLHIQINKSLALILRDAESDRPICGRTVWILADVRASGETRISWRLNIRDSAHEISRIVMSLREAEG